jgi:DNA gyrase subunit A
MSGAQKLKEGDEIQLHAEVSNKAEILCFTDQCQVYKGKVSDFSETKASVMGDYLPTKFGFDEGERFLYALLTTDYSGDILFFFENGKAARVPLASYATKTNRRKLQKAYSDKSPLVTVLPIGEGDEFVLASGNRRLILNPGLVSAKTTRDTQGVAVMTLKKNARLESVERLTESTFKNPHRYRSKSIPVAGALLRQEDVGEQLSLTDEQS